MIFYSYVGDVNLNLICCICHSPFLNPVVTTTCSHTFCGSCIEQTLERQPCCPVDRSPLSLDDLKPENLLLRNMVDELTVECPHASLGCKVTCQRQLLNTHLRETCQYVQVPCSEEGCEKMVLRRDVGKHTHDCVHRLVSCPACGASVTTSELETHTNECAEQETECVACYERLKRGKLNGHIAFCSEVTIACSQSEHGCPWAGKRKTLSGHLEICPYEAIKGFFTVYDTRISALRDENTVLRQNLNKAEASLHAMTRGVAIARRALGPWWRETDNGSSLRVSSDEILETPVASSTHSLSQSHSSTGQQQQHQHQLRSPNLLAPNSSPPRENSPVSHPNDANTTNTTLLQPSTSNLAFLASYFPPDGISSTSSDGLNLNSTSNPNSNSPPITIPPHPSIHLDPITRHLFPYSSRFQSIYPPPFIRFPDIYQTHTPTTPSGPALGSSSSHRILSSVSPLLDINANPNMTTTDILKCPTLPSALQTLQSNITTLSQSLDLLTRRTDIALTTENLRMNEEVGALRAIIHGLRMQVHALITERNGSAWGGAGAGAGVGPAANSSSAGATPGMGYFGHHASASSGSGSGSGIGIGSVQTTKL